MTEDAGMGIPTAKLLADDTRAAICLALLDGRVWTAGELARLAGVAPSTVTAHLSMLVEGGLLAEERQGRHRYVRLAGPHVAELLEHLAGFVPPPPTPVTSLRSHRVDQAMAFARTCYDHLAGRLAVAITDVLVQRGRLTGDGLALTGQGRTWLEETLKADLTAPARRPLSRPCIDWTERRPHLAGVAGKALLVRFRDAEWVAPVGRSRALRLTADGRDAVREAFGLDVDQAGACAPSAPGRLGHGVAMS